jgi:hypothetical protein
MLRRLSSGKTRLQLGSGIRRSSFLAFSVGVFVATAPAQAPRGDPTATAFASITEREVSQLREGITLAKWMSTRGKREHWESKKPEIDPLHDDPECLSLVKIEALPSGAKLKRALYFYPPRVSSPVVFPTASRKQLINACALGMVWMEVEAPTPEFGNMLDQAVRQKLAGQYGESIGDKEAAFWGRGYYGDSARWVHTAEIVSGYNAKPGYDFDTPGQFLRGPVVFVHARLPRVKELEVQYGDSKSYYYRPIEKEQFDRAIAMAGVDAPLTGRLQKLYEQIFQQGEPHAPRDTKWRESLLPVLREWIGALKTVLPARRAAGLLTADLVLVAAEGLGKVPGWPEGGEKRSELSGLQELGAVFELSFFSGEYFYTRNWEKQARELDSGGAIAQIALIVSMARTSCNNAASPEFFRQAILDGEGLLAMGLDAQTAAQVHFMVGDAYSTVVAIAGGLTGPNGELDPEPDDAGASRGKALQNYRAGLAVDYSSDNAKDAWRQAWRLTAGLLPSERYVCFGD